MAASDDIARFLSSPAFGVVGASNNRTKFGNKVLRCYEQNGRRAYPVNPNEPEVEGHASFASVKDLPAEVESISIITRPEVTERVVVEAIEKGIRNVWMQPGAESPQAVALCHQNGINVIADGSCVLTQFGFRG